MNRPEGAPPPAIDPQRLAALVDGKLSLEDRTELLDRLGRSPEDLALLADVAAISRESGDAGVVSLEHRRMRGPWRQPRTWLAIAAVAAGIALAPWYLMRGPDALAGLPDGWNRDPWGGVRGAGGDAIPDEERAVRVGVRLTQLDVSLAGGDTAGASLARDLARLIAVVPGSAPTVSLLETAAASASAGNASEARDAVADARDGVYVLLDSSRVALGAWAERARLAARAQNEDFFTSDDTRAALERAQSVPDAGGPASSSAAADLRGAMNQALLNNSDESWARLGESLVALIAALSL